MRLKSLRIQNFRAFSDETIELGDYTCLVGANGTGKSTIINALDVFFQNTATSATSVGTLEAEDFHRRNIDTPIQITLTFMDLSEPAQNDLRHYYRHGELIVAAVAEWDAEINGAKVVQHGFRTGVPSFRNFFAAEKRGALVRELREIYAELRTTHHLPGPGTKAQMVAALHHYEERHPEDCEKIPSSDQFYGATGGKGLLEKYIQWVHVPAVKQASDEGTEGRRTWLSLLLERAVRTNVHFDDDLAKIRDDAQASYEQMLEARQTALAGLSESLTVGLAQWAHPDASLRLAWAGSSQRNVIVAPPVARVEAGNFGVFGSLERQGHGFQRSYLLALAQTLVESDDEETPRLLLACEEPELYQHPPQARHLAGVFRDLARRNTQVLLCTHSPHFVSGQVFEDVRLLRWHRDQQRASASRVSLERLTAELRNATGTAPHNQTGMRLRLESALTPATNEMFFCAVLVLVEGQEDEALLWGHLTLTDQLAEFRRYGCHVLATHGKSKMSPLLAIARQLDIPCFTVFDADTDQCIVPGDLDQDRRTRIEERRALHEQQNRAILSLCGFPELEPLPETDVWQANLTMWHTHIGGALERDFGRDELRDAEQQVRQRESIYESKTHKNPMFLAYVLEYLHEQGQTSNSLERLCGAISAFARAQG